MFTDNLIKQDTTKNEFISFARGYAILTIVLFHFCLNLPLSSLWSKAIHIGGGGVHLFIFASGFGLGLGHYSNCISFLKRRLSKILIPYYITITIIFLVNIFLNIYPYGFSAYLSHIFLYKMFIESFDGSFGYHFWFISTIIQFYLFFPLINLWINKFSPLKVLLIALFISITYSLTISLLNLGQLRTWNSFFLQYLWEFILGMFIAKKGNLINKITEKPIYIYCLILITAYSIMAFLVLNFGNIGRNLNDFFSFIGYASLSIIVFKICNKIKLFKDFILNIETFSYSLFLTHYFIYHIFKIFLLNNHITLFHIPIIFMASLCIAYIYNKLINLISLKF